LLAALSTNGLDSLAYSPSADMAASSLGNNTFNVRSLAKSSTALDLSLQKGLVIALSLSQDGKLLAIGANNGTVTVRRVSDGSTVQTIQLSSPAAGLAFSPDGNLLAVRTGEGIRCWQVNDGSPLNQYDGYSLVFSQDSSLLAITSVIEGRNATRIRQMPEGSLNVILKDGSTELAFSPDASLLAISGPSTNLWSTTDGTQLAALPDASPFGRLAFSPDGHLLAQLSPDGILRLWGVP
jgi:WD40 repeat protein